MRDRFSFLVLGLCALLIGIMPRVGQAAEGFRLAAPAGLIETGLLKYVLPRFSLKTGVRIEVVEAGESAQVILAPDAEGPRVFTGPKETWRLQINDTSHDGAVRFADWLTGEVGQRTVTSYQVDGATLFALPAEEQREIVPVSFDGDPKLGQDLSVAHCARCHAVNDATRMNAMASTPSFMVLRSMTDWDLRFQTFYVLAPHPAFTQIEDVTEPFPIDRPSPIAPMEITLDELEAILAYVSAIPPADLGAPIQHK